ncbi:alpha/beta hydrolase [Leptospira sp. 201903070]|uniref:Alpha/beta hydrolase n=1 Tax=Leptospira ainlahdjerensis TaxID=2810033 RepID=A0ABS2U959_9LEPT|nr:alpha/beta hydrolase [Leptospira ainlahdjerensis]MBM9576684.1 alpha/beta hydrolase [Leptospira ainlahdjerensis]
MQKLERIILRWILKLPEGILRRISGGILQKRERILDAKLQMSLYLAKTKPRLESLAPKDARTFYKNSMLLFDLESEELFQVENFTIPVSSGRIGIRLYRPTLTLTLQPALVYFHGGGFVIGDLDSHDRPLRYLAKKTGSMILSVDYRLGPEHKYPTAVEDSFVAYQWILKNAKELGILSKKIAVGGDSAGGNLAANLSILSKKKRIQSPLFQLLIYPYLDLLRMSASRNEFGRGYALTNKLLEYFNFHYLKNPLDAKEISASPILHKKKTDFPKTYIQLAGFDPLQDEALELIESLKKAKVPVTHSMYESLVHGYFNFAGVIPEAKKALDELVIFIKEGFQIK